MARREVDLGPVDAYAIAVEEGYTGTREQWVQAMADAEANGLKAEGYATGKQNGIAVESGEYFENNAKYYNEQAQNAKDDAETAQGAAEVAKTAAEAAKTAAETAAARDTAAWLSEHITNPNSPPLDRTLSSEVSAAPADMVGDLNRAFEADVKTEMRYLERGVAQQSSYYKTFRTLSKDKVYVIRLTVETAGTYTLKFGTGQSSGAMVDTLGEVTLAANGSHDFIGYIPSTNTLNTSRLSTAIAHTIDIYEITNVVEGFDNVDEMLSQSIGSICSFVEIARSTTSDYYKKLTALESGSLYAITITATTGGDYTLQFGTGQTSGDMVDITNVFTLTANHPYTFMYIPTGAYTYTRLSAAVSHTISVSKFDSNAFDMNYLKGNIPDNTDLNDITNSITYLVNMNATHCPYDGFIGWVQTKRVSSGLFQLAYEFLGDKMYKRRKSGNAWSDWSQLIGGNTYNNTITNNTYSNSYTITTFPTITTDTNGWLASVDTDTSSETGKTDMTGAIMSMLNDTGYCHLGEGIFYVSGGIDLPVGATIEGCGAKTVIRLLASVENGYCVKLSQNNTVRGIKFSGSYSNTSPSSSTLGGRNGINFVSNADGQESAQNPVITSIIDECWFQGFNGCAIYAHNTGGDLKESLIVANCYIDRCGAGINLDYYAEYCKFTNIITYRCYYACINNGGNNVFSSCTFHGTIGMLLDNSTTTKRNNSHGSAVGCTFNHIDNWNNPSTLGGGKAVRAINNQNGFIFTGCQFFYGAIDIDDCKGFAFSDCLFGGSNSWTVSIVGTGEYPVFFSNCIFNTSPSISLPAGSKINNCYLSTDGSQITT